MSLALRPIEPVKIMDPILDFDQSQFYGVVSGGQQVSWKPITSTSYSNVNATFSAPPPSPAIAVGRHVKLVQPVQIIFTGNAPLDQGLLQSQYDAPRAYPLSSIMNSLQVDLNNTSFSINMSDTIHGLLRYHNPEKLQMGSLSTTPSLLDQSQQYGDLANSIRNPLASYIDSNDGAIEGRGGFPYTTMANGISTGIGNDTTSTVTMTFVEDLFISPLLFGTCDEDTGFIGLQTFQLIVNWATDLSRIWSHSDAGGTTLTNIDVILQQPTLLFQYKTPSPLQTIPSSQTYPYYEIQRYPTTYGSAVPAYGVLGNSIRMSSNNIQLNSIPRMMYIWARKQNADLDFTDTDTFFSINNISINWANNSGLLSNATKYDLYQMSKKNGCNLSWTQWSGEPTYFLSGQTVQDIHGVGSVLAIEFGTDIGLPPDECAGLNGTYQLQMEVTIENQSAASAQPTLYVVIVNEGTFTIENNSSYSQIGVLSRQDVLDASKQPGINYDDLKYMAGAGYGGSWKKFSRGLRRAFRTIRRKAPGIIADAQKYGRKAKQLYDKYGPQAQKFIQELQANGEVAGLGYGGAYIGGDGYGGALIQGGKAGGKRITSSQLRKRLTM